MGENKPSKVIAEVAVDLKPFHDAVLEEWEDLRENDVLFLVRLRGTQDVELEFDEYLNSINGYNGYKQKMNEMGIGNKTWDQLSQKELGIEFVRGCQIIAVRDGDNPDEIIGDRNLETQEVYKAEGTKRIYDVELIVLNINWYHRMVETENGDGEGCLC